MSENDFDLGFLCDLLGSEGPLEKKFEKNPVCLLGRLDSTVESEVLSPVADREEEVVRRRSSP